MTSVTLTLKTRRQFGQQLFWVLYLAIALVCVQASNLHFHVLDHEQHDVTLSDTKLPVDDVPHMARDTVDESEVDITPTGILKHLSVDHLAIAVLFWTFLLLFDGRSRRRPRWPEQNRSPVRRHSSRRPPLRAPPY